jgi:hypothetical protein
VSRVAALSVVSAASAVTVAAREIGGNEPVKQFIEYFDRVYVINLIDRPDRQRRAEKGVQEGWSRDR